MLIDGKATNIPHVEWGDDNAVCIFCAEEYAKQNNVSPKKARDELHKKFIEQKLLCIRGAFDPIYVCHKHLEQFTKGTETE